MWILNSTQEDLNMIVINLLRGKYGKIGKKTDEEFVSDCNNYYSEYF